MNDFFDIVSIIATVSFGLSLGFFLKWLFLIWKNRVSNNSKLTRKCRHYMEAFCIFFSLVIACVAVILIATKVQTFIDSFSVEDVFYYSVLFITILISVLFFRILAPVICGFYILYCGIFAFLFFHSYSVLPKEFTHEATEGYSVELQAVVLSTKNLLPLPRHWISEPRVLLQSDYTQHSIQIFQSSIDTFGIDSVASKAIIMLSSLIVEKDVGLQTVRLEHTPAESDSTVTTFFVHVEKSTVLIDVL